MSKHSKTSSVRLVLGLIILRLCSLGSNVHFLQVMGISFIYNQKLFQMKNMKNVLNMPKNMSTFSENMLMS